MTESNKPKELNDLKSDLKLPEVKFPKIQIFEPNFQNKFSIATYNVAQALGDEKYEYSAWKNRRPGAIKQINELKADILLLQEVRELPGNTSVNKFLSEFDQYEFVKYFKSPYIQAFCQVILYDKLKFFLLESKILYISETPEQVSDHLNKTGNAIVCAKFIPCKDGKAIVNAEPFWIFNVHFPFEESAKDYSCARVIQLIKEVASKCSFIVGGDWNFFEQLNGKAQKAVLTKEFSDLSKDTKNLDGDFQEGTFIGFEHDTNKSDITSLEKMTSKLDNFFGSKNIKASNPIIYVKKPITYQNPSDHLPLKIDVQI